MGKCLISIVIVVMSGLAYSQSPTDVVEQQLKAYNSRDIDSFMAIFHTDIEIWTLGNETPSYSGWEAVKDVYSNLFDRSPKLHSTVLNRSVIGNKVIDYERIAGRNGTNEDLFLVMIFEVVDGKIRRAWAVRE